MDDDNDALEPETPEGSDAEEGGEKSGDAKPARSDDNQSEPTGNRFTRAKSLSERFAEKDDEDDEDDLDDDPDDDDDETEGDKEPDRKSESEDSGKPKGESKASDDTKDDEKEDEGDEPGTSRFEIVDAAGSKYELDLPDGATIKFNADGKTVELDSVDKLVQMAQKGEAFDRVTSRIGSQLGTAKGQIKELSEDAEADRELVKAIIRRETGAEGALSDEEFEKLKALFDAEDADPESREAKKALAEKREREKAASEGNEEAHQQASATFWQATREQITESIESYPYLEAEDVAEVEQRFYAEYNSRRAELIEKFTPLAKQHGVTEAQAVAEAERIAIEEKLNRKTLRSVMKSLDSKYAKRAGKGGDGKREKLETKEAERHNRQIEARRSSSKDPANRSLRSGGIAVSTREPRREKDEPDSFEGKIENSFARFRKKVSQASRDDDDE